MKPYSITAIRGMLAQGAPIAPVAPMPGPTAPVAPLSRHDQLTALAARLAGHKLDYTAILKTCGEFAQLLYADDSARLAQMHAGELGRICESAYRKYGNPPAATVPENQIFIPAWNNEPPQAEPLISLNGKRLLTKENIAVLTAHAGVGKTSILEAACASIFPGHGDTLGLLANVDNILFIDSERAFADSWRGWSRCMRRAGAPIGGDTTRLRWESIRGLPTLPERTAYLWNRLESADVPQLVIIDGFGDFVADPNDSGECTALVYRLSAIACERRIGIWGTLHTNPGGSTTKARGVLGSELWRKAESALIIEKLADGTRRLTSDYDLGKNRGDTDDLAVCFKWNDAAGMHTTCAAPINTGTKGAVSQGRTRIIGRMGRDAWSYQDLKTTIMDDAGKSEATAKRWISELVEINKIVKNEDGTYSAVVASEG